LGFRLRTLQDLRARTEEEAEARLAAAIADRVKAEGRQADLDATAARARAQAAEARARLGREAPAPTSAGEALGRTRYVQRLDDASRRAVEAAERHRAGPVAGARRGEEAARQGQLDARRDRQALERHAERLAAAARREGERRTDDAAGDLALATFARTSPRDRG
jgi:hypothetical protein